MLTKDKCNDPILQHVRKDFVVLDQASTVQNALEEIRRKGVGHNIIYFYVVNDGNQLVGVIPTRKLLIAPAEERVEKIMVAKVVAIPDSFNVLDACEYFAVYKFMAFPVVDKERHILGVVDVGFFADEIFDFQEREQMDSLYETLGFRISQLREASIFSVLRLRFPWLLTTVAGGIICAFIVGHFELTLTKSLVLAFFLTLMLGLGESVSVQTMTIVIHSLRHEEPDWPWYRRRLGQELVFTFLLGLGCAVIVGAVAYLWKRHLPSALVIAAGIVASFLTSCFFGVSVPALMHKLKLDLKIASGPLTLALADICTIGLYFGIAVLVLGR